ncbi:MAG: 23S rRNA (guanosine(2251)-2'-O)-methyltransferase RlmB [Candidatus Margulisiibacteriota bacterium]
MQINLDDLLSFATSQEQPLLLLLDGLEDPRNFGAILRTAEAVGVCGVIIPKRRSVGVTDTVQKTSTGAVDLVRIAQVSNLTQTIARLKDDGYWIVGMEASGNDLYTKVDYRGPIALVIGSEGNGISRLVKENCDFLVRIPMYGEISSLNASVAAAILMYETVRQRNE